MGSYQFGEVVLSPSPGSRLSSLCVELEAEFPRLRMQRKIDHWYWRWIAVFLKVVTFGKQTEFLSKFTTVVGLTVALGEVKWQEIQNRVSGWEDSLWATLMHERRHMRRFRQLGVTLCALLYLLVFFPVGLAWGRAWFEREGYTETLRCWYALDPEWACSAEAREWWIAQFTGPSYGWAWPFRKQVQRWFDTELVRLKGMTTSTA